MSKAAVRDSGGQEVVYEISRARVRRSRKGEIMHVRDLDVALVGEIKDAILQAGGYLPRGPSLLVIDPEREYVDSTGTKVPGTRVDMAWLATFKDPAAEIRRLVEVGYFVQFGGNHVQGAAEDLSQIETCINREVGVIPIPADYLQKPAYYEATAKYVMS